MCSYVPVKEMNVTDVYEINHISTAEMKSSEELPFAAVSAIYATAEEA